jgi:hypothetical protein
MTNKSLAGKSDAATTGLILDTFQTNTLPEEWATAISRATSEPDDEVDAGIRRLENYIPTLCLCRPAETSPSSIPLPTAEVDCQVPTSSTQFNISPPRTGSISTQPLEESSSRQVCAAQSWLKLLQQVRPHQEDSCLTEGSDNPVEETGTVKNTSSQYDDDEGEREEEEEELQELDENTSGQYNDDEEEVGDQELDEGDDGSNDDYEQTIQAEVNKQMVKMRNQKKILGKHRGHDNDRKAKVDRKRKEKMKDVDVEKRKSKSKVQEVKSHETQAKEKDIVTNVAKEALGKSQRTIEVVDSTSIDDDDDDEDDDNETGYSKGPIPNTMLAELYKIRTEYEEGIEAIAQRFNRSAQAAYRAVGDSVVVSRDPNIFNIFEQWWVAEDGNNQKVPDSGKFVICCVHFFNMLIAC